MELDVVGDIKYKALVLIISSERLETRWKEENNTSLSLRRNNRYEKKKLRLGIY